MLVFNKELELTFVEAKVSKAGNQYQILRVISDNGSTLDCVYKGAMNLQNLKMRQVYNIQFQYIQNKSYSTLEVLSLTEVA